MTKKSIKAVAFALAILGTAVMTTSCNRGYGCPQNFEVNQDDTQDVNKTTFKFNKAEDDSAE